MVEIKLSKEQQEEYDKHIEIVKDEINLLNEDIKEGFKLHEENRQILENYIELKKAHENTLEELIEYENGKKEAE